MPLVRYFFFLFLLVGSFPAFSQQQVFSFKQLTSVEGLSQNSGQCFLKDKYGFMWFGTQDGLNQYNGLEFKVFKHDKSNPSSLPANDIRDLLEDKSGNIWIGTRIGGFSLFDRDKNSFVNYVNKPGDKSSLSYNNIRKFYEDRKGNFWIGTDSGLNLFNRKTKTFTHFFNTSSNKESLSSSAIRTIFEDKKGNFWIGTGYGLNLFNRATGKSKRFMHDPAKFNSIGHNTVNGISEDASGNLWVGTNNGLSVLPAGKTEFKTYKSFAANYHANNHIHYIKFNAPTNQMWLATAVGLQIFDVIDKKYIAFTGLLKDGAKLGNNPTNNIYIDKQGVIWVGSISKGIYIYDRSLTFFPAYRISIDGKEKIEAIRGIAEDSKGNFWITSDNGWHYFNNKNKTLKQIDKNIAKSGINSMAIISRKDQEVWIGSYIDGLSRYNPKTNVVKSYKAGNTASTINSNYIYTLCEDKKGRIWIGTENRGVNVYSKETNTFIKYEHNPRDKNSLADNSVMVLREDSKGNIWIGGQYKGLSILNTSTGKFTHLNSANSNLSNNSISAIHQDNNGNMWVGTMEGGLNFYNKKTKKFISYTESDSDLPNNYINYITHDKKGHIWVSTNQGISRFDPVKKVFRNYSTFNGLQDQEFNQSAGFRTKNGVLLFGGIKGFNVFNPDSLAENTNPPPVVLTGFELFNKPVIPAQKGSPLTKSILYTKEIILSHKQTFFAFEFAALDYTVPEKNQYAYKLEGFDKNWNYIGNQHKATYTNLDPGTYKFRVKASNNEGLWNEEGTSITLIITPPFWMEWWFRILSACAILGGFYIIYAYRVKFIKQKNIELEKQVNDRTEKLELQSADLRQLNGALQAQSEELLVQSEELLSQSQNLKKLNEQLTLKEAGERQLRALAEEARMSAERANHAKSTFLATMSHEIRTPMNGVLGMTTLLSDTELNAEQREYAEIIRSSGEILLYVINDILDFSKIESGNMQIDPHEFDLAKCIEEVLDVFGGKAAHAGLDLVYQIDNQIPNRLIADGLRLRQVLINIIGNAIKFTSQGEIFVDVKLLQQLNENEIKICFQIRDTGIGIPEEKLSRLFKAFSQVDSSTTRKYGGTGLGLVISERLIDLMGGKIKAQSKVGEGTTFSFSIKCEISKTADLTSGIMPENCLGKKVLLVDDNKTNLQAMENQLKLWGLLPTTASSGAEALALINTPTAFDLVITDMQMPGMNGVGLSEKIKETTATLPILLLSSIGNILKSKQESLFTVILSKPVKHEVLLNYIQATINNEPVLASQKDGRIQNRLSKEFAKIYPFKILIAEDNRINQKLLLTILNKLGYSPALVTNGQEALNIIHEELFDLVLLDMQMPGLDGLETARCIRKRYGQQHALLAITANAMTEDREACLRAGMNEFISKPIKLEELITVLQKIWLNSK